MDSSPSTLDCSGLVGFIGLIGFRVYRFRSEGLEFGLHLLEAQPAQRGVYSDPKP